MSKLNISVQAQLKAVQDIVNANLAKYFNEPATETTVESMKATLKDILAHFLLSVSDTEHIKIKCESVNGEIDFKPLNLFTALLINNVHVSYEEVKDKTEYYIKNGTHLYGYLMKFNYETLTVSLEPTPLVPRVLRATFEITKKDE